MSVQRGECMEAIGRWWNERFNPWKLQAQIAEQMVMEMSGELESARDEISALKTKLSVLQLKVRANGKKVRRRI